MTVQQMAEYGDWKSEGNVDYCDVTECVQSPARHVLVDRHAARYPPGAPVVWLLCLTHHEEYIRACNELYDKH